MFEKLYGLYHTITQLIPRIQLPYNDTEFTPEQKKELIDKLSTGYYVILVTERKRLSSLFVSIMSIFVTGRWGDYTHALMNCDQFVSPNDVDKFKFVEATATGVHYSNFDQVFNGASKVCLLTPKGVANKEWTDIIDTLVSLNGKPYDDLFDLLTSEKLSCVEVVLDSLKVLPDFEIDFRNLIVMIEHNGNLVPQMFRNCPDFDVALEFDLKEVNKEPLH